MKKTTIGGIALLACVALAAAFALLTRDKTDRSAGLDVCDPRADGFQGSCKELDCEPGFEAERAAGECCPQCVPKPKSKASVAQNPCQDAVCTECAGGTRAQRTEGECCPKCIPLDDKSCEEGRRAYQALRSGLESDLRGCTSNEECTFASFTDSCQTTCPLPLNKHRLGEVVAELRRVATERCSSCAEAKFECPHLPSKEVACVSGRCEFKAH